MLRFIVLVTSRPSTDTGPTLQGRLKMQNRKLKDHIVVLRAKAVNFYGGMSARNVR